MKLSSTLSLAIVLGMAGLEAALSPESWHSEPLATAGNGANGWYFFPDLAKEPRVLVKNSGNNNNTTRKLLTGGPPVWTEGTGSTVGGINKQGVFVSAGNGEGFLVAPHGTAALKVAVFSDDGSSTVETIDPNAGTYTGISAEIDSTGKLHVGYIANGNILCYARRNAPANWNFTSQALPGALHDTAVVPTTFTDVRLYYSMTYTGVRTLWRAKPGVVNNVLYILWQANPAVIVEHFVGLTLKGSRIGNAARVFYFGSDNTNSWKFRRVTGDGDPIDLETAGNVSPGSIHTAIGPDGNQRVAWYNETHKRVHYLRPISAGVDVPVPAGFPVTLAGNLADPDLLGLHFDADGMPCLLYRTAGAKGFIAFPNDTFDFNHNGRPDLLDVALGSAGGNIEALPVGPPAAGVSNSANRFKFRFPTVGSATAGGNNAVTSASKYLRYGFELSTNGIDWSAPATFGTIQFTTTGQSGTNPNQHRTMVGVVSDPAPGEHTKRFARMTVSRTPYPY